ncbi:MAG: hypothetical protein HY893_09060 [Deltaproteobacteria bacterium]|nr:hypothetical protein [Deltaproteobacteria bacterium]
MARRGGDSICALIGAVLLFLGALTFLFPAISYKSKEDAISLKRIYVQKKIIVPQPASAGVMLAGSLLLYRASKIRNRRGKR